MRRLLATVVLLIAVVAYASRTGPPSGTPVSATRTDEVRTVELRVHVAPTYTSQGGTEIIERTVDALVGHPGFAKRFALHDGSREHALERVIEEFEFAREFAALAPMAMLHPSSRDPAQRLPSNADVGIIVNVYGIVERLGPNFMGLSLELRVNLVEGQSRAPVAASSWSAMKRIEFADDNGAGELPREVRAQLIAQALPSLVTAAAQQAFDDLFAQLD